MRELPKAYWSNDHQCWYVPVAPELLDQENLTAEPVRVEIRDGELWITQLTGTSTDRR